MKTNRLRTKLDSGGVAIGTTIFEFNTTGIGRIVANAGCEFVVYDMEHTGWGIETIRGLIATSRSADVVPIVRVPAIRTDQIARVLDVGAMGVMVPMVETVEQAEQIVRAAKYFPEGERGAAFGISHDDFLGGDIAEKMKTANREGYVIALIETVAGIENVEAIAQVPGVDCLWLGSLDLSQSLGSPGNFSDPPFLQAVERLVGACRMHGKAAGVAAGSPSDAEIWLERGFTALSYSIDVAIFQQALTQGVREVLDRVIERQQS